MTINRLTIEADERYYQMNFEPAILTTKELRDNTAGSFIGPDFCSFDFTKEHFDNDFMRFVGYAEELANTHNLRLFQNVPRPGYSDSLTDSFEHLHFGRQFEVYTLSRATDEAVLGIASLIPHLRKDKPSAFVDTDEISGCVESPISTVLVARKKDEVASIIGVAVINITHTLQSTRAYLDDVIVDPMQRGLGVGRALYDAALEHSALRNAERLEFTSHASRTAAHALYLAAGAEIIETTFFRHTI